jgi:hypothetical protein
MTDSKSARIARVREALWSPDIDATELVEILGAALLGVLRCAPDIMEAERALETLMAAIRRRLEAHFDEHGHTLH